MNSNVNDYIFASMSNSQHVSSVRLLCVAFADNFYFTESEADHLVICHECYREWQLYVQDFCRGRKVSMH